MANLELAAAFGAADAAKEQDLRGYYPMAARVLAEEVRRLKAERDALAREAHVWSKAAETYAEHEADAKRLDWLMANSGLIFGHGWWALKTYADTAPDDPLGVLDWIDAAMLRAEDADARNEEQAARTA